MLSSKSITASAGAASKYYAAGDYYTKGAEETSRWAGLGAARLGLTNEASVEAKTLEAIFVGQLPDGHEKAWRDTEAPGKKHRAGRDFTFSAPKSVSVAALVGGDDRLIEAHERAVDKALGYLETYAMTRVRMGRGQIDYRLTENIVAGTFLEFTSRAEDANLHTHAAVANMTFDAKDGRWRSMDYDGLETAKMASGQIYRNELARHARALGWEVETDPSTGFFELKGVPAKLIEDHSTRSHEIDAHLAETGTSGSKARARAALVTRDAKKTASLPEIADRWRDRAGRSLPELQASIKRATEKETASETTLSAPSENLIQQSVRFGIEHATAGEAVVDEAHIVRYALQTTVGETRLEDVEAALSERRADGRLLRAERQTGGRRLYRGRMQSADLRAERRFRDVLTAGRNTMSPMLRGVVAEKRLGKYRVMTEEKHGRTSYPLTDEQFRAAKAILTSKDRVLHVQGVGGAGKSAMVGAIVTATPRRQHLAIAKAAVAAQGLGREANIDFMTVDKFLGAAAHQLKRGAMVYVDEASMLGTRAAARIDALAEQKHFRVVVMGDARQLPAIEQGKPHALAERLGAEVLPLTTSRRHKTEQVAAAVKAAREGRVGDAIARADNVNLRNLDDLAAGVASAWASLETRDRTRILALDNRARVAASDEVRAILKREGALSKAGQQATIYSAHSMTRAQMKLASLYPKKTAVLVFHQGYNAHGLDIERGATFQIEARAKDVLVLSRPRDDGGTERIRWRPGKMSTKGVSVYERQTREIAVGDLIQWKKNEPELANIKNGVEGRVEALDGLKALIAFNDGVTRQIDLGRHRHWDHGYAITTFKAQGATYDRALVLAPAVASPILTQDAFYTALSRARYGIDIWTNDRFKLTSLLNMRPGGKSSSLEGRGETRVLDKVQEKTPEASKGFEQERSVRRHANADELVRRIIESNRVAKTQTSPAVSNGREPQPGQQQDPQTELDRRRAENRTILERIADQYRHFAKSSREKEAAEKAHDSRRDAANDRAEKENAKALTEKTQEAVRDAVERDGGRSR
ncbi:MAG: MobF family relaxase [Pseudomonadota bacterium]